MNGLTLFDKKNLKPLDRCQRIRNRASRLTHFSTVMCVSYRNQSFVLLCKANEWFLYETQLLAEMG